MDDIQKKALEQWHQFTKTQDNAILNNLLDDEIVFHSPVVWTPQKGKPLTMLYLNAAVKVLKDFQYIRQIVDGNQWALEFNGQLGEVTVRGIDLITLNENGKIIDFEVMVRPLKAVHAIHASMAEMLENLKTSK